MKFLEMQQGTPEWLQARAGKITASCFAEAISVCQRASGQRKAGDPTAAAERYAADLAIERISGAPHGEPIKAWVLDRGHQLEGEARIRYEARSLDAEVTESGICMDDDGIFAYSSDGLVGADGLIEIKCPIDSTKVLEMWRTGDVSEYIHQIQGGMWLTGRKWLDLIMYVPDLANVGKDMYIKRIPRDDVFIDYMASRLAEFAAKVDAITAEFRAK